MKPMAQKGLFEDKGFLWTESRVPGQRVYGEKLRLFRGKEYRNWNPFRSKLAAYARRTQSGPWPNWQEDVLYLGASTGTTVSHVSDMLRGDARVFAVEFSARSVRDLLWNMESRQNVIPILDDAGRPERYAPFLDRPVGTLMQDVAQRHQVDIFLRNMPFLAPGGLGYLFVKARSINVSDPPTSIYNDVTTRLKQEGLDIVTQVDLEPFEKDHRAIVIRRGKA